MTLNKDYESYSKSTNMYIVQCIVHILFSLNSSSKSPKILEMYENVKLNRPPGFCFMSAHIASVSMQVSSHAP